MNTPTDDVTQPALRPPDAYQFAGRAVVRALMGGRSDTPACRLLIVAHAVAGGWVASALVVGGPDQRLADERATDALWAAYRDDGYQSADVLARNTLVNVKRWLEESWPAVCETAASLLNGTVTETAETNRLAVAAVRRSKFRWN